MEDIVKQACKKFGCKGKEGKAKIYDKNGVDLGEDDVQFIKPDDIIYIALDGKLFPHLTSQVSLLTFPQLFLTTLLSISFSEKAVTVKFTWQFTARLASSLLSSSWTSPEKVSCTQVICLVANADMVQNIYKEAQNLKALRHKSIVELYHAFVEGKTLILIMEYAGGGMLLDYVTDKYPLGEVIARKIFL